jgi:hypothetical protein
LIGHAQSDLWQELTYLAYHLHWSLAELVELEHRDRARLVEHVGRLNDQTWNDALRHG